MLIFATMPNSGFVVMEDMVCVGGWAQAKRKAIKCVKTRTRGKVIGLIVKFLTAYVIHIALA